MVLPRGDSRILHQKGGNLRERTSVENSYMLSTMTRSCTLYIPAQLPSVHSPDQVQYVFLSSLNAHTSANGSRKKRSTAYDSQFFLIHHGSVTLVGARVDRLRSGSEDRCSIRCCVVEAGRESPAVKRVWWTGKSSGR